MSIWTVNGILVVDSNGAPIECDTCPCDGAVPCGNNVVYTGGASFPNTQTVNLGSGAGHVVIDCDAAGIPDRFVVFYDGVMVIDSGYLSDPVVAVPEARLYLLRSLPGVFDEITGQTYPFANPYHEADGYPAVNPIGSFSFYKPAGGPTTAEVRVYAPAEGTGWDYTVHCPDPNLVDPPPSFPDIVCDACYDVTISWTPLDVSDEIRTYDGKDWAVGETKQICGFFHDEGPSPYGSGCGPSAADKEFIARTSGLDLVGLLDVDYDYNWYREFNLSCTNRPFYWTDAGGTTLSTNSIVVKSVTTDIAGNGTQTWFQRVKEVTPQPWSIDNLIVGPNSNGITLAAHSHGSGTVILSTGETIDWALC